jgi:transposase-like protein
MAKSLRDPQLERRWRELVERQRRSGESVRRFCERNSLSESSFHYWRAELARRDAAAPKPAAPAFVPVRVTPATSVEVVLRSGVIVRAPAGSDIASVAKLVAALEAASC